MVKQEVKHNQSTGSSPCSSRYHSTSSCPHCPHPPPPHCPHCPPPPHCDASHDFAVNGEADTTPLANPPSTSTTLHKPFGGQSRLNSGEKESNITHLSKQAGMRSYFNGSSSVSGTPPPAAGPQGPGRPAHNRPGLLGTGRASSSSLPRSPVS